MKIKYEPAPEVMALEVICEGEIFFLNEEKELPDELCKKILTNPNFKEIKLNRKELRNNE